MRLRMVRNNYGARQVSCYCIIYIAVDQEVKE